MEERIKEHKRNNKTYFDRVFTVDTCDNFEIEIIDEAVSLEELNQKEIFWIATLKTMVPNGYNLCAGGGMTNGYHHTEEAKAKMSETKKSLGSMVGESNHFYGKTHSEETKAIISKTHKGSKHTQEHRDKISKTHFKSVVCVTTGEVFESIKLASEYFDIESTHITRVCKKKRKTVHGLVFEYVK